jgi:RHH-type proline utilization regulon transcriptional repressor/proline dehydrogenase/delta 1-pyrroline-5-carboxylate dehydrogenase
MGIFERFLRRPEPVTIASPSAPARADGSAGDEAAILEAGRELLERSGRNKAGVLSGAYWSDALMNWSMKDEAFKVQLFRFVDAFPTLKTSEQVHDHLEDYLSQPGVTLPPGLGVGLKAGGLAKGLVAKTMSGRIEGMASNFIAGRNASDALPKLERLWKRGYAFSVDLLGEACVSHAEADAYRHKYLDLVENLHETVSAWAPNPRLDSDHLGPIARTNVSIKISSLYAATDPIDFEGSLRGLVAAVRPVLEAAADRGVFVNFDMEQRSLKDLTIELFKRCCDEVEFEGGIAMQAYLRSGDEDARNLAEWSVRRDRPVTVRLVKGAYWDYETIHAEQMGWPVPVWSRKRDSDACFERMSRILLDATPRSTGRGGIKLALGSHNARSIAAALAHLDRLGLPRNAIELQMLYGMGDELKAATAEMGLRLREYVPVGEMIPGMAYLVRRLLENTSNESWLRAGFADGATPDMLLASPHGDAARDPGLAALDEAPRRHHLSPAVPGVGDGQPFFNESMRDFADPAQRTAFGAAVETCTLPKVAIDATEQDADRALDAAHRAFPSWRDTPFATRADVLVKAADAMRRRRDELSGIVVRESGKTWREADADVCEAIDFCEFYARTAAELFAPQRIGRFVGELDEQWHQPRGVAAVISPWNFPLAICCGMTAAALVTGNTAIVKPAEQTPAIARILCEILWAAGCPREVLHFVPGPGETVGARLVRDRRTAIIAFTGSKAVGLDILQAAGVTPEGQPFVKKVVCEMGGKNALIIDASADLDEAVLGVRHSAFGFAGQKCSACSRAIVLESCHDEFLHRLVESTRTLVVGDPLAPGTDVGPVIDEDAARKIREYVEIGRREGVVEIELPVPEGLAEKVGKPFVGPTVVSGIRREHRLANEEVFGPVLAVIKVKDFDEALEVANATDYKLTGGVFSRKPAHLERARRDFRVGNLYLNRGITGALVARQPFGGFGLSGVGSKAGGRDYLHQFVEPRAVCENTMRRGFAPGLE